MLGRKSYAILLLAIGLVSNSALAGENLTGAGSTFIDPIFEKWAEAYPKTDSSVEISYQSVGSLQGIDKLLSRSVDFAASDAPLALTQLDQPSCQVLYFPVTLGAVVVVYNLPQVPASENLKLTGTVVADIFRGKIRKWNDPAIAGANPGLQLPDQDIFVTYREDGSGTTYTFTDYLSKVSTVWENGPGRGLLVKWPIGLNAEGNEGVTQAVKNQTGAIGYVELQYATSNGLRFAQIQNRAGQWVQASPGSTTAASASFIGQMPTDLKQSITDAPGDDAYPISSYSYLLLFKHEADSAKSAAFGKFLLWALKDGQAFANPLNYGTLPSSLASSAGEQLKTIEQATASSGTCKTTLGLAPHHTGPLIIHNEEDENSLSTD